MTTQTIIGYKLFKLRADGTLGPLFINARQVVPLNEWLPAEDHPTKGFAHRPGWHATFKPVAPHLAEHPKHGPARVWMKVEMAGVTRYDRPESQGGTWALARAIRVIGRLRGRNMETQTRNMDDIRIGPAGETFGQLKARVLESRAVLLSALCKGTADDELCAVHQRNVDALEAAYGRVGLPYEAP